MEKGFSENNPIEPFVYHVTKLSNLNSILETGLGAKIGQGIDQERAKMNMSYSLNYNPYHQIYTKNQNYNKEKSSLFKLILHLCLGALDTVDIAIIKIDTSSISKNFIIDKSEQENLVVIYKGIIDPKHFSSILCFHLSDKKEQSSIRLDPHLYFKMLDECNKKHK